MPSTYKRIRLACELQDPTRCVNELTGKPPVFYLSTAMIIEIAIFQDGALVPVTDIDSINIFLDDPTNPVAESIVAVSMAQSLTASAWKLGTSYLMALELSSGTMASLTAGTRKLRIQVVGIDGSTSDALYADVTVAELGPITVAAAPSPAISYWNKTEANARFGAIADVTAATAAIVALEAESKVLFSSQTLTAPEQTQARANIGARASGASRGTGWVSAGAGALVFADYQTWFETITASTALTATGSPDYNIDYVVNLAQNATGGFNVTWPATYTISPAALINPKPSTSTAFRITAKLAAAGAKTSIIEPLAILPNAPDPTFRFDTRAFARITPVASPLATGGSVTSIADIQSGLVSTAVGTKGVWQQSGMLIGPAVSMGGAGGYYFGTTAAAQPMETTIPDGFTVALVFDSRAAADCFLMNLGPMGLGVMQRGGNLEFGSRSTSANRVAIPFTPNDSIATVAIFTYLPGGGATGIVIKNGVAMKVGYAAGATTGTTLASTWELFQNNAAERFTGYVSHVAIYDRALAWEQQQSLALKLCADFGITPTV
jgi:hypothetical protein